MTPFTLLNGLPDGLRKPLIDAINEVSRNYTERRWEPAELNGGKLCEIVYTIIDGTLSDTFSPKPNKPKDLLAACRNLEQTPSSSSRIGDRSLRILIPRILIALYEIRNNRGVGHAGGDVDPNFMDATAVYSMCHWIVAELIRIFHQVSAVEAKKAVDLLIERKLPIIWEKDGTKRVILKLKYPDQCLVLLYSESDWISVNSLLKWTEYRNSNDFRKRLLTRLHKERSIEFEKKSDRVIITHAGVTDVEKRIFPKFEKN